MFLKIVVAFMNFRVKKYPLHSEDLVHFSGVHYCLRFISKEVSGRRERLHGKLVARHLQRMNSAVADLFNEIKSV